MDYETFNPHEKAGDYYRRGGRDIRTWPDGLPPSYNFPEDMLVRDLIEDGIYTLPVLRASTESIERIVRQDAQVKRIPTRAETEKRDRIFGGPEQAETWDMIEEVARWVLYTDAEGYDIAGTRIQQLGSNRAACYRALLAIC